MDLGWADPEIVEAHAELSGFAHPSGLVGLGHFADCLAAGPRDNDVAYLEVSVEDEVDWVALGGCVGAGVPGEP